MSSVEVGEVLGAGSAGATSTGTSARVSGNGRAGSLGVDEQPSTQAAAITRHTTTTWAGTYRRVKQGAWILALACACHRATPATRDASTAHQHANVVAPATNATALGPLPDASRRVLFASKQDEPPTIFGGVTKDAQGQHYLTSNERGLHAFEPTIRARGGGYLGVGTDQGYLLVGWARSEFAWFVDYDPMVAELHGVYRALIIAAETPEDFLALWAKDGKSDAHAAIDLHAPSDTRAELRTLYRKQRVVVAKRLVETVATMAAVGVPCWLDDAEQYDHVRDLVRHGRTRAMLVDLAGDHGLAGIGKAATAAGLEIDVVYLSNAEEYWRLYPSKFRRELVALPMPDDAVVLRTLLIWHVNRDYRYNVQRADNLRAWFAQPWVGNVYHVTYQRPVADPAGLNLFEVTAWPDDAPSALRAAAKRKIRELVAEGFGT